MHSMLSRVVFDLQHLRHVHAVVPDQSLGRILKDKICRLNLKPALAELQATHYHPHPPRSSLAAPAESSARSHQLHGDHIADGIRVAAPIPASDLAAVSQLLECLAYFELAQSPITAEAMELARYCLPSMNIQQLSSTLAACCALGQQEASISVLPLLVIAFHRSDMGSNFSSDRKSRDRRRATKQEGSVGAPSSALFFNERQTSMMGGGSNLIVLMEALQRAGVKQEEVWAMMAEHCVRNMDELDGRHLLRVIEIFHVERVTYYPDFFAAAESYIASHGGNPSFMSGGQLQEVMGHYKSLGQPVVALLSVKAGMASNDFNAGLEAASARRSPVANKAAQTPWQYGTADLSSLDAGSAVSPALGAFTETAVRTLAGVDAHELLDLMRRCVSKEVMHCTIMDAAVERLVALYFGDEQISPQIAQTLFRTAPQDLMRLTHTLLQMLSFKSAHHFTGTAGALIQFVLDAVAAEAVRHYHQRLLFIAQAALQLLPEGCQPTVFYTALTSHLRHSNDSSNTDTPRQLLQLAMAMMALEHYGGRSVLVEHMPVLTVAATNAPRRTQIELAACLATLPEAREQLLPALFRACAAVRGWERQLGTADVRQLLEAMQRSGLRDAPLLTGVVAFIRANLSAFESEALVQHLFSLAVLGYREIDLYTAVAAHLLEASTVETRGHTTVHDLCLLLYVFTFVIKGVIRIIQQILSRLRVSAGQATARDITLAMYSLVRLQVVRHHDVTGPLCDRATTVLGAFTPQELASLWGSLRAIGCLHAPLLTTTCERIVLQRKKQRCSSTEASAQRILLSSDQYVCIVSAMVQLVSRSGAASRRPPRGLSTSSSSVTQFPSGADVAATVALHSGEPTSTTPFAFQSFITDTDALGTFKECALQLAMSETPGRSGGLQIHRTITTLALLPPPYGQLSEGEWALLAVRADVLYPHLTDGLQSAEGHAAAETLIALQDLRAHCTPTLPSDEPLYAQWSAIVEGWQPSKLPSPPKLVEHVRSHSSVVKTSPLLKAGMKRVGLLSRVTAVAVGATEGTAGLSGGAKGSRRGKAKSARGSVKAVAEDLSSLSFEIAIDDFDRGR